MAEAQERVSPREFWEWVAFYRMDPWGEERADLRMGQLAAMTGNIHRKKGARAFKASDFILFSASGKGRKGSGQSVQEMKAALRSFAGMHNARLRSAGALK